MKVCPKCKKQNEDGATACWNCKALLKSAELVPAEPAHLAASDTALPHAPPASPLAPSAPQVHVALLEQFERLLGRRPDRTEQAPQLALELKGLIDLLHSDGALPQQQDLLNKLNQQLGGGVSGGEAAAPVISALLNQLEAASNQASGEVIPTANGGPQVAVPAVLTKIIGPLPQRFQWLAMVMAPLLLGGGMAVPLWQTVFSHPEVKLQQATADADRARKENDQAKADFKKAKDQVLDLQTTITDLNKTKDAMTTENSTQLRVSQDRAVALESEASRLKINLQRASDQLKDEQKINMDLNNSKVAMTKEYAARTQSLQEQVTKLERALGSSRTPVKSGFVVWKGIGNFKVGFQPNPDHGSVVGGAFPSGDCRIEAVFGEHVKERGARNSTCGNFSFDANNKSSETTAYILWRLP